MGLFLDRLDSCINRDIGADRKDFLRAEVQEMKLLNDSVRALAYIAELPMSDSRAQGDSSALLSGVPIVVKDLIDVAGMPTRAGSRAISRVASVSSDVIDQLLQEGACIVGKSHTTEFAMSGWGQGPLGRPLNPIDGRDEYFSGGSSNGSASAIASGMVPAALGTDTGGSVRIPSSWCGITGLKGSPGWVSTQGVVALSQSFDTVGAMARTAADAYQLFRAMLPTDRRTYFEREVEVVEHGRLPHLTFLDEASLGVLDDDVLSAYRASRAHCEAIGFTTDIKPIPCGFSEMAKTWAGISAVEGYLNNKEWAENSAADLGEDARSGLLQGRNIDLGNYFSLLNAARQYKERMERLLTPGTLLVVPTTSTPAVKLTGFDPSRILGIYTRFVNLIMGCSIALPNGMSRDNRPTSMQFVGGYGQDAVIVRAAMVWQKHTDWHEQICSQHREQMKLRLAAE